MFYRKPPAFSDVLCKTTTQTFYYSIPLHLFIGLYMYSEIEILAN